MRTIWTRLGILAGICGMAGAAWAQQAAAPPPAGQGQTASEMRKAMVWKRFDYVCEGGAKVTVFLRNETAKVRYQDKQYLMKQTASADGNRYSDGKVVWWGKGNGGFLQQDTPEWNGEMIVKDCKLAEPAKKNAGVVSGTVSYLQRVALPPTAVLEVKLQDVSKADAPATVIAEQKITTAGKQPPIPFELKFDEAKIDAQHRYTVSARITVDGQLRFASDQAYAVLTQGNSAHVEFVLKPAAAKQ